MSAIDTARAMDCSRCGVPILLVWTEGRVLPVNWVPHIVGGYAVTDDGDIVWDPHRALGDVQRHTRHQCPQRPTTCRYCADPVLILHFDPATPMRNFPGVWLVVADPDRYDDGQLRMTCDGWVRWRRPDESWGYRWHTKHVTNGADARGGR